MCLLGLISTNERPESPPPDITDPVVGQQVLVVNPGVAWGVLYLDTTSDTHSLVGTFTYEDEDQLTRDLSVYKPQPHHPILTTRAELVVKECPGRPHKSQVGSLSMSVMDDREISAERA